MEKMEQRPNVEMEDKERQALVGEYSEMMLMLPRYFADAKAKMEQMRQEGIPDPAKYEKLRGDLLQRYDYFDEMSHRFFDLRDEVQKVYTETMDADAQWHEERKEPSLVYEEKVEELMEKVVEVETNIEKAGRLTDSDREQWRHVVMDMYAQLEDLDRSVGEGIPEASRERRSLVDMLSKLSKELRGEGTVAAAASTLGTLWATHQKVKAKYAEVQHILNVDQRREMRERIARLSALVLQAEDSARPSTYNPPPPAEPPSPEADIRTAIQLAMSRAASAAPVIASAVAPIPPKGGLLAALSDTFKLR